MDRGHQVSQVPKRDLGHPRMVQNQAAGDLERDANGGQDGAVVLVVMRGGDLEAGAGDERQAVVNGEAAEDEPRREDKVCFLASFVPPFQKVELISVSGESRLRGRSWNAVLDAWLALG